MPNTATHNAHGTTPERVLFVAFALREKPWKLGCTTGHGQMLRECAVAARHQACLRQESVQAKRRCGLPEIAPVVSGSAAGREGYWRHRFLQAHGSTNAVGDSSSLAVKRRQRRAKSAGLAVRKLVRRLMRYAPGARDVWCVVPVPAVEAEAQRPLHRALEPLQPERASTTARLKGLRSSQGIRLASVSTLPEPLEALRWWNG